MIAKFGFSTDCDSDDDDDDDDDGDDTQVVQIFKKSPTKLYCTFFPVFPAGILQAPYYDKKFPK